MPYFTTCEDKVVTHDLSDEKVVRREWTGLMSKDKLGEERPDKREEMHAPTLTYAILKRPGVSDSETVTRFDLKPAIESFAQLDRRAHELILCSRWWNPSKFDFPAEKPQTFLSQGSSIQILCGIPFEQKSLVIESLYQQKDHKYLRSVRKFFDTVDSSASVIQPPHKPVWHWCLCSVATKDKIDIVLTQANEIIKKIKTKSLRTVKEKLMTLKLSADGGIVYSTHAFDAEGNKVDHQLRAQSKNKTREFVESCKKFEKYLDVCCDVLEGVKDSVRDLYAKNERCKLGQSTWTNTDEYILQQAKRLLAQIKTAATFEHVQANFSVTVVPAKKAPAQPDRTEVAMQAGIAAVKAQQANVDQSLISEIATDAYSNAVAGGKPGAPAAHAAAVAGIASYRKARQENAARAAGRAAGKRAGEQLEQEAGAEAATAYLAVFKKFSHHDTAQLAARVAANIRHQGKRSEFCQTVSIITAEAIQGAFDQGYAETHARIAGSAMAEYVNELDDIGTFPQELRLTRIAGRKAAEIYELARTRIGESKAENAAKEAVRAFVKEADESQKEPASDVSGKAYIAATANEYEHEVSKQASRATVSAAASVGYRSLHLPVDTAAVAAAKAYHRHIASNSASADDRVAAAEAAAKAAASFIFKNPGPPPPPVIPAQLAPPETDDDDYIPIERGDDFDVCKDARFYSPEQLISKQEFEMMQAVQFNLVPDGKYRILDVGLHGRSCELLIDMQELVAYHGVTFYGCRDLRFASFSKNPEAPKPSKCGASPEVLHFISSFYKEVFPCIYVEGSNPFPSNFASLGPKRTLHGQMLPPAEETAKRAEFLAEMAQLPKSCSLCAMTKGVMEDWRVSWLTPRGVYHFCEAHVLAKKNYFGWAL